MSITQKGNPRFDGGNTTNALVRKQTRDAIVDQGDTDLGMRIQKIINRQPNLSPGVLLPLAKSDASSEVIDTAGAAATTQSDISEPRTNTPFLSKYFMGPIKTVFKEAIYDPFKGASRGLAAFGSSLPDVLANVSSYPAQEITEGVPDELNVFNTTKFADYLRNFTNQGSGFTAPQSEKYEQDVAALRGTYDYGVKGVPIVPTIGKNIAEALTPDIVTDKINKSRFRDFRFQDVGIGLVAPFIPKPFVSDISEKIFPYGTTKDNANNSFDLAAESAISGLIDGTINIFTDPTVIASKTIKTAKTLSKGFRALSGLEDVAEVSKTAKAAQLAQTSLDYVGTKSDPIRNILWTPNGFKAVFRAGEAANLIPDSEVVFNNLRIIRDRFNTQRSVLERNIWQDATAEGLSPAETSKRISDAVGDLTDLKSADEAAVWNGSAIKSFVKRDARAAKFFEQIVDTEQGGALPYRIRHFLFRDRISIEQSADIADIVASNIPRKAKIKAVEGMFVEYAQRLKQGQAVGLFPTNINDLTSTSKFAKIMSNGLPIGGMERGISNTKLRKFLGANPTGVGIVVDGSHAQRAASINNYKLFLSMDPTMTQREIYEALDPFEKALTQRKISLPIGEINPLTNLQDEIKMLGGSRTAMGFGNTESSIYSIYALVEKQMARLLKTFGASQGQIDNTLNTIRKNYSNRSIYAIDEMGHDTDYGLFSAMLDPANGVVTKAEQEAILVQAAKQSGRPVTIDELRKVGPSVSVELLNSTIMLPNIDTIRQLTSNKIYSRLFFKDFKAGQLAKSNIRAGFNALDTFVNEMWKPGILANPAFLLRNVLEGQGRLRFLQRSGVAGIFQNPVRYMQALTSKITPEDLTGNALTYERLAELSDKAIADLSEADQIFIESTNSTRWSQVESQVGPNSSMQQMVQDGSWNIAKASDSKGRANYVNGILDHLRLINLDPLQRLWAHVTHFSSKEAKIEELVSWLDSGTESANKTKMHLISLYENEQKYGFKDDIVSHARNPMSMKPRELTQSQKRAAIRLVLSRAVDGRVSVFDEIPELRAIMTQNVIPVLDINTNRAVIEKITITSEMLNPKTESFVRLGLRAESIEAAAARKAPIKDRIVGGILRGGEKDDFDYFVLNIKSSKTSDYMEVIKVQKAEGRVNWAQAGNELNYDDDSIALVTQMLQNDINEGTKLFPESMSYAVRREPDKVTLRDNWRNVVSAVFNSHKMSDGLPFLKKIGMTNVPSINGAMTILEKLPTYRQLLWTTIMENAKLLSPDEIKNLPAMIEARAGILNMTPNEYMGGSRFAIGKTTPGDRFEQLKTIVEEVKTAKYPSSGTLEELNTYAHAKSKSEMENLFFDSGTKLGYETGIIARLNFQFATAQRSVLADAISMFAHQPIELYKAEKAFMGAAQIDLNPYDQRPGFFYKDPQTNQYNFKVPFTDTVLSVAGALRLIPEVPDSIRAYVGAPVKGLNMGLGSMVAFGPVGQFAAQAVLKVLPLSFEDKEALTKVALPYGTRPLADILGGIIPGWAKKTYAAILADTEDMNGLFANNYVNIGQALMTSSNYDKDTREGMAQLESDAKDLARIMTIMQAASQFFGPATGTPQYEIQTKDGNFVATELLAKELRRLQTAETPNAYETSILEWLKLYGNAVAPYAAGKTKSSDKFGGLETSQEFFVWQNENKTFFEANRLVAGFFAPGGSEWSWSAYKYQLDKGQKTRMTLREILDAYTYAIGASKFREVRSQLPTFLNSQQEQAMRLYRKSLSDLYSGYPAVPKFDTAAFPVFIDKLTTAVEDPVVKDTDMGKAIISYLNVRASVVGQLEAQGRPGLRAKSNTEVRARLAAYGRSLISVYPEFQRIYDRELSAEVELVGE